MSRIMRESGHYGYCRVHGKYECATCTRADERDRRERNDFGLFEWRSDGRYTRGTAIKLFKSEKVAQRAAEKYPPERNVVVRPVPKESSGG